MSKSAKLSKASEISKEPDMDKLLIGYEILSPEFWDKIQYGTHIRYLRTDGTMRNGGFVKSTVHTLDLDGKDTIKIELASNLSNGKTWSIYKGNTEKIWKKIENNVQMPAQINSAEMNEMKEDIERLKKYIQTMQAEMQQTKNENMRILKLIKSLHKLP